MKRRDIKYAVSMLKQMTPEQQKGALDDLWALLNVQQGWVILKFEKFWYVGPKGNKKFQAIELLAKSTSPEQVERILELLQEKRADCVEMASYSVTSKKFSMDQRMDEIDKNHDDCLTTNRLAADSFTADRLAADTRK